MRQITNDQQDLLYLPTKITPMKTGPNSGVLSTMFMAIPLDILTFESTNSGTYTKFADYGQGNPDVTYGDFSLFVEEQTYRR